MAKNRKHFYAVAVGRHAPMVSQSWPAVHDSVSGFPKNKYQGFETFQEAIDYLAERGHATFHFDQGPADGDAPPSPAKSYAAHKGRLPGVQSTYSETKPLVHRYSHACHKSYANKEKAADSLDWLVQRMTLLQT